MAAFDLDGDLLFNRSGFSIIRCEIITAIGGTIKRKLSENMLLLRIANRNDRSEQFNTPLEIQN